MKPDNREKYLLYADDDTDDQEIMADMIAVIDASLEVVTVNNGREALEFLNSLPPKAVYPCFIILDINMPQFDGLETLRVLKSNRDLKDIPVVMFSTSNERRDVEAAKRFGAQDFITKPIHSVELNRVTAQFSNYCHHLPIQTRPVSR